MKFRSDFVTNSSSGSFLFILNILFNDNDRIHFECPDKKGMDCTYLSIEKSPKQLGAASSVKELIDMLNESIVATDSKYNYFVGEEIADKLQRHSINDIDTIEFKTYEWGNGRVVRTFSYNKEFDVYTYDVEDNSGECNGSDLYVEFDDWYDANYLLLVFPLNCRLYGKGNSEDFRKKLSTLKEGDDLVLRISPDNNDGDLINIKARDSEGNELGYVDYIGTDEKYILYILKNEVNAKVSSLEIKRDRYEKALYISVIIDINTDDMDTINKKIRRRFENYLDRRYMVLESGPNNVPVIKKRQDNKESSHTEIKVPETQTPIDEYLNQFNEEELWNMARMLKAKEYYLHDFDIDKTDILKAIKELCRIVQNRQDVVKELELLVEGHKKALEICDWPEEINGINSIYVTNYLDESESILAKEMIEKHGGVMVKQITSNMNYLIVRDKDSVFMSEKMENALSQRSEYPNKIITFDHFVKLDNENRISGNLEEWKINAKQYISYPEEMEIGKTKFRCGYEDAKPNAMAKVKKAIIRKKGGFLQRLSKRFYYLVPEDLPYVNEEFIKVMRKIDNGEKITVLSYEYLYELHKNKKLKA